MTIQTQSPICKTVARAATAAFAALLVAAPAFAGVIFSDATFNPGDYSASSTFTTAGSSLTWGQCASCGNPGAALRFDFRAAGGATAAVGLANITFAYDPGTQGKIIAIDASVDKNLFFDFGPGSFGNTFRPLVLQDGMYYLASIAGPSLVTGPGGGSTGYNTISRFGLLAADFTSYNFSTGTFGAAHPNFGGNSMLFGLGQIFGTNVASTAFAEYDNLSLNIHSVPEPATLGLLGLGIAGIGLVRRKRKN